MGSGRGQRRTDLTPALSIVIPAYNEGQNILTVLEGVHRNVRTRPLEVLIIYDFEGDTTVPAVQGRQSELPEVRLARNRFGRGVLNALKTGLAEARAPWVIVMMADGSDDPADIERMLAQAISGADLVAASRYMPGGRQVGGPIVKRLLSRTAGLSLHWLAGISTHDPTNNFKLYGRRLLDAVTIESTAGFELALELTVKAARLGLLIAEIPTTWRDRSAGTSRFRMRQWIPHYLRWYRYGIGARLARRPSA